VTHETKRRIDGKHMSRDDAARHDETLPTKVVGRRRWRRGLEASAPLLQLALELRGRKPFLPRGVYRFRSFEESDEWILKMLTRPRKPGRRF
jgi:hypothetical protein